MLPFKCENCEAKFGTNEYSKFKTQKGLNKHKAHNKKYGLPKSIENAIQASVKRWLGDVDNITEQSIFSPMQMIEIDNIDSLSNYLLIAENIDNKIEKNEFYRTYSESLFWLIREKIDSFNVEQLDYKKNISQLETEYGKRLKIVTDYY